MFKKIIAGLISSAILMVSLVSCNKSDDNSNSETADNNKQLKVIATIFPQYDWTKQILGDDSSNVDLSLLIDNGVDLHSFQPTTEDIINISSCDMLIYTGGESDAWVEDALKNAQNDDMIVINLMDVLGDSAKEEIVKEGMQEEEHEHDEEEGDEHEEEPEIDEHVWLSLKNAQTFCNYISEQLATLDSNNADKYTQNAVDYNNKLSNLDKEYAKAVDSAKYNTLVFADRFPFRYLVDDYELDYFAAFVGCSAETEASFETVIFLANKINELGLNNVMVIETSDKSIANTVIENTKNKNQEILVINSLQSVTSSDITDGTTYLLAMQDNLEILKKALN